MSDIETVTYAPGSVIIKEGEKADSIYFILSGTVEVSVMKGGTRTALNRLSTDAVFGEMSLIDNRPRSATVTAVEKTECLKGKQQNFIKFFTQVDPAVKTSLNKLTAVLREKNASTPPSPATQAKVAQLKKDLAVDVALQQKVNDSDPFVKSVYRALFSYL